MKRLHGLMAAAVMALAVILPQSCGDADSQAEVSPLEAKLIEAGMVDIHEINPTIAVHLVYATPYNFMGVQLYHGLDKAYMLPELAQKVSAAQKLLKKLRPDLNLIVYDAARPLSVQHEMWNMVKDTDMRDYVGDPTVGHGMHNYGAAVDVTLMSCTGDVLEMGSEYDYFGDRARTDIEPELLENGLITQREYENRLLLRKVMVESGLIVYDSEWWHFNLMPEEQAVKTLKPVE